MRDGSSPRVRGTLRPDMRPKHLGRFIPACAGNTSVDALPPINLSVHPRVCGEHHGLFLPAKVQGGSSPRVRGTHRNSGRNDCGGRFIPACAGNTPFHPLDLLLLSGSSPRVRGTHCATPCFCCSRRFIPACAGNTCRGNSSMPLCSVHPRVCGEHFLGFTSTCRPAGSSPRVRGTRLYPTPRQARRRFIPACAGNTRQVDELAVCVPVHPRVCGEHRGHAGAVALQERFIPACAGNTRSELHGVACLTVHPRVCGEHPHYLPTHYSLVGSSPRVRGTRHKSRARRFFETVHPRVCGEHRWSAYAEPRWNGSSPRVRGTHLSGPQVSPTRRFIPACAGNTRPPLFFTIPTTVHPRVCGEHPKVKNLRPVRVGSSPRVRGTLHCRR